MKRSEVPGTAGCHERVCAHCSGDRVTMSSDGWHSSVHHNLGITVLLPQLAHHSSVITLFTSGPVGRWYDGAVIVVVP